MIIKVQSAFRGHLTRKLVKKIKSEMGVNQGMNDPNMLLGNFENEHVQSKRDQLGQFQFDSNFDESYLGKRIPKEQTVLESGARYHGEWLENKPDVRQGRGT